MRDGVAAVTEGAGPVVSGPSPGVGQRHPGRPKGEVVQATPGADAGAARQAPAEAIIPAILAPLKKPEGIRLGFLGNTGKGKTFGLAWVLGEMMERGLIDCALIVDDKNQDTPYPGAVRVNPAHLRERPPGDDEDAQVVLYRGVAVDPGRSVDVEEVAAQSWELARQEGQLRVALVVDEARRAVSPAGREWRAPTVARVMTEGRAARISMLWSTQSPQRIPVEAFDNSILAIFGLGHRGRAYLERADLISPRVSAVIAALEPRQFVIVDDAGDWDGTVYIVPQL